MGLDDTKNFYEPSFCLPALAGMTDKSQLMLWEEIRLAFKNLIYVITSESVCSQMKSCSLCVSSAESL